MKESRVLTAPVAPVPVVSNNTSPHFLENISPGESCVCCPDGRNCALSPQHCPGLIVRTRRLPPGEPGQCVGQVCEDGSCCTSPSGTQGDIVCCPDNVHCAETQADCPRPLNTWITNIRKIKKLLRTRKMI